MAVATQTSLAAPGSWRLAQGGTRVAATTKRCPDALGVTVALGAWMFFYIYMPSFQGIPGSTLIPTVLLLAFALVARPSAFFLIAKHRLLLWFSALWWIAIVYGVLVELLSGADSGRVALDRYPVTMARFYVEGIVVAVCLVALLRARVSDPVEVIIRSFYLAATVQFVFVILMLFLPAWRDYYFTSVSQPMDKLEVGSFWYQARGYGVGAFHLFSYPLFNGLVFFISTWMAVTRSYWYLLLSAIALVPVFLNARIGLIFVPIFFLSVLLAVVPTISLRPVLRYTFVTIAGLGCVAGAVVLVATSGIVPAAVVQWALAGIAEYGQLLMTGESHTLQILADLHMHLPAGSALITGEGEYLFRGNHYGGLSSDIGYVNFLFYGGLFFSALVYASFLVLGISCFRAASSLFDRCVISAMVLGLFAAHFKGIMFESNPFMKAVTLLMVAYAMRISLPFRVLPVDCTARQAPHSVDCAYGWRVD